MNFKKVMSYVPPKLLSRIISVILAALVAILCFQIARKTDTDTAINAAGNDTESTKNEQNNDVDSSGTSGVFLRDNVKKIGNVITSTGAVVCSLSDNLLIAERLADDPKSTGDSVTLAVALMTAKAISEGRILLTDEAVCPASAIKSAGYSASSHILPIGRRMSISDILRCMIFQSGSSYAITLAVHISGGTEVFTSEMNGYLATLGISCVFADCTGDIASNISPYDLAVMLKHFYNDPILKEIIKSETPTSISVGQGVDMLVKNDFFTTVCTPHQAQNDGILGGKIFKNGVGAVIFSNGGKEYIVITMNGIDPFSDALMLYSAYVLA